MVDETGSSTTMRGSFAPDTEADTALAAALTLAGAVVPISDCVPVRVSVSYRRAFLPASAPGERDSALDQGLFIFETEDAEQLSILSFGGFNRELLTSEGCFSGEQVNLEDSAIAAFVDAVTSGIWCNPFGADITAVKVAYLRQVR